MNVELPIDKLARSLGRNALVRLCTEFEQAFPEVHLKDLVVEQAGPGRTIVVAGRPVVNFGSDSFLGLDRDPRVLAAIRRGLERWGAHNGASAPSPASSRTSTPKKGLPPGWAPNPP